ncbi:hypothetical protein QO002_006059 [Pararhizobium capsulatum DSM 1112]|uniref:Transmembrane protein n=1 Tax=Pararhizobium capsulatum DSM 1112 TaxID=1121113 RepID=A0ABU0C0W8_9HYPH|nr:hypothetical protein [Pararhizobium capsulatum DSM 1112]
MDDVESQSPIPEHDASPSSQSRTLDPSESVTGVGLAFGIVGAIIGVVATLIIADASRVVEWVTCSLIGALAGGSAGVVVGGLVGAIFGVLRGVTVPAVRDPNR